MSETILFDTRSRFNCVKFLLIGLRKKKTRNLAGYLLSGLWVDIAGLRDRFKCGVGHASKLATPTVEPAVRFSLY